MLNNFFSLNNPFQEIPTQVEFERLIGISSDLKNLIYKPDELKPTGTHPKLRIRDFKFSNFSFSKTVISDVVFINCKFTDCLFIGVTIKDCEFHNCVFKNVNTFKISIEETYVNPESFINCIKGRDKSNIAIHLFQQLLHNSKQQGQAKFSRVAEYNFKKWRDKLILNKFIKRQPYGISVLTFLRDYPINSIFRITFGYGLRFRNFFATFLVCFLIFFSVNYSKWQSYSLAQKDISIEAFNPDSVSFTSNFFYTLDVTTKLIDSQFQPKSDVGMFWLSFQSIFAFILLSALITLLVNRFVR
ncbi:hypothetical protein GM418_13925 [Maribellus comscasis]|uniref:Pentapeptide repeat-containing protein n=1 Tax=Maribellus comscasis TaxID=2681766 RepID=A0A6I6JP46_9BACT|nr:pentapeptide repeat-containing protein [Maribellus comscasis]QGY44725.1 hypothetical protein GM418_13925 [Maribellus comscasis]